MRYLIFISLGVILLLACSGLDRTDVGGMPLAGHLRGDQIFRTALDQAGSSAHPGLSPGETVRQYPFGFNNFSLPQRVYEVTGLTRESLLGQVESRARELRELGVTCVRIHPDNAGSFAWDRIDMNRDGREFDFSMQDELVRIAQGHGLEILPSLSPGSDWINNPRYLPQNQEAYRQYVLATVERYDGDGRDDMPGLRSPVRYWQMDNEADLRNAFPHHPRFPDFETPEEYARVLRLTCEAMKLADPQARLMINLAGLGQGAGDRSIRYLKRLLALGAMRYCDLYSTHIYPDTYDLKVLNDFVRETQSIIGRKPLWITEMGIPSQSMRTFREPASPVLQALWIVQAHACLLAAGVQKVYWLSMRDASPALRMETPARYAGLKTFSGERKPGYYAYRTMTEKLRGYTKVLMLEKGVYRFEFQEREPVLLLWSEEEKALDMRKLVRSRELVLTPLPEGGSEAAKEVVPASKVPIGPGPVFAEPKEEKVSPHSDVRPEDSVPRDHVR